MANLTRLQRRLQDAYAFPGFRPHDIVRGVFGDPKARVLTLIRRSKKLCAAAVVACTRVGTIARLGAFAICRAGIRECIWSSRCAAYAVGAAAK